MHRQQTFHHAFQHRRVAADAHFVIGGRQLRRTHRQHLNRALRRGKAFQAALAQRIDRHYGFAALRDVAQRRQHTRMVGAGIVADTEHQIAAIEVLQLYRALAYADRLRQADAGRFMAHIGTVGKVIGAVFACEELPEKGRFVRGAAGGVEFDAVGILIAAQQRADLVQRRLPFNGLIGVARRVIFHRVGQAPFAFQLQGAALPEFAHGVRGEKFRRGALAGGLPGDRFGAVFAKFKRGAVLRVGPGAAWAVEPFRLVDLEQRNNILLNGHLAAYRIRYRLERAPAPCRTAIWRNTDITVLFFHTTLLSSAYPL